MLLSAQRLSKSYILGEETLCVVSGLSLFVARGEFVAIMGTSGSGKSTLMHLFGGLTQPDSGSYSLNGRNMLTLNDTEQSWVRANWIGFVFQTFNLLPELNVVGNVSLPFLYKKLDNKTRDKKVSNAIERVGLAHRKKHRPSELSGGEMQRVAIARALVIEPLLILADEPTGNLDARNSDEILRIFHELNSAGSTIIMVTHDPQVAAVAQKKFQMSGGILNAE
ncbi:MAG: ABC transporter ATP-binding protein [Desulfobacterales bacterium]|nr:ABC transporter ATP-binding protein [Deltaproteobacteria bacterium]NNK93005.1 ABC transporter ATP-binding protein [Desulfobacterales bacterium]